MENLKSYLDGELDLAQQTEVETHLRNDAQLQEMVEEFRAISSTLKTAETGEPYGLDKLEERLANSGKLTLIERKNLWRKATTWSASSALVILIATITFPVFARAKSIAKNVDKSASMAQTETMLANGSLETSSPQMDAKASGAASSPSINAPSTQGRMRSQFGGGAETPTESQTQTDAMKEQAYDVQPLDGVERSKADTSASNLNLSQKGKAEAKPNTTSQWYSEPESDFKSQMRLEKNKSAQTVKGPQDTPQGIYLERAGEAQVKVEDVGRAVNEATGMAQGLDGFVVNSNIQNRTDGGMATMTLRVPTKNFQTAMERLEKMGERLSSNSTSQDITTEMVDNGTRMVSWADEEKRVMDALAKAKDENRKYYLRQELSQIRVNLEAYRAQVKSLKQRAEFSTINATFVSGDQAEKLGAPSGNNWSGNAYKGAKDNLSSVGQMVGVVGIYFLVFSPIWLPFVIAALVIRKKTQG